MKAFSDLCVCIQDQCSPATSGASFYVGLEHIGSGTFFLRRHGSPADVQSAKTRFRKGDILYGKLRPYLDKAVIAPFDGICSTDILVFRAKSDVCPTYLLALIHAAEFRTHADQTTNGVNHPRTSWHGLAGFGWEVPPKRKQEKIAAILWKIQRAIEVEEKLIATTRELKQAAMRQLFTHGLRGEPQKKTEIGLMPQSWAVLPLSHLTSETETVDLAREGARSILYVDVSSVSRHLLQITSAQQYLLADAPGRARKKILEGDVIFATVRPTLLRVARVEQKHHDQVCSTAFCVLRDKNPNTKGHFLLYLVQRPQFVNQLAQIETGASYPAVTDRQVKSQLVPVPHDDEQRDIANILKAIDQKISFHERKRATLQDLFQTLLHQLMTATIRVDKLDIDTSEVATTPTE